MKVLSHPITLVQEDRCHIRTLPDAMPVFAGSHKLANPLIDPPDMQCPSPGFSFYRFPIRLVGSNLAASEDAWSQCFM